MGDGQRWMFPHPPAPGTDREYDALVRCLLEAEDADDARSIELALGILLLSRNYDPLPSEYEAIFSFGADQATRSAAQAAISDLIYNDLEKRCVECLPQQSPITSIDAVFRRLQTLFRSCAARFRSTAATLVHSTIPKRPSSSRKLPQLSSLSKK
jgi:hypothetical protein